MSNVLDDVKGMHLFVQYMHGGRIYRENLRANSIAYSSTDSSIEKNPRANPIDYLFFH
jgi:hypothetical protein